MDGHRSRRMQAFRVVTLHGAVVVVVDVEVVVVEVVGLGTTTTTGRSGATVVGAVVVEGGAVVVVDTVVVVRGSGVGDSGSDASTKENTITANATAKATHGHHANHRRNLTARTP